LIICRKDLDPVRLNTEGLIIAGCELMAVSLSINRRNSERLVVVSFYKPPDVKFNYRQWRLLFEGISGLVNFSQIVVLGDFNAQSEAWGSTKSNSSGEALNRFLVDSCFRFLNDGSGTRISATPNYNSVPDLTVTNSTRLDFSWQVGEDPLGSDHLPVEVIVSKKTALFNYSTLRVDMDTSKRSKLSLKNFDGKLFPLLVQNGIAELSSICEKLDPLQSWYDFIVLCSLKAGAVLYDGLGNKTAFIKGRISTVPLKKRSKVKQEATPNSLWWDKECERLVNKRKWAYKRLAKCPSRENLLAYRSISAQTRKGLQKKKRDNFRDFVKDLNLVVGPLKFWNTVKRFKNSHHFGDNFVFNHSKQDDIFSYISKLASPGLTHKLSFCKNNHYPSYFNHKIRLEEIKEIIESINADSSPGPDLVNYSIIKLIPESGIEKLVEIFEKILKGEFYPTCGKIILLYFYQRL